MADVQRRIDRTAVIVGVGGIGEASALHLLERGFAHVYLLSRPNSSTAEHVHDQIRNAGLQSTIIGCDATDWHSIEDGAAAVEVEVDALVYTAGHRVMADLESLTQDVWLEAMNIYAGGFIGCAVAFRDHFANGASAVALSGTSAHRVVSDAHLPMGVAKAALERSVGYLSRYLAHRRVRVNGIACGPVETAGVRELLTSEELAGLREAEARRTIASRLAQPEDIARLVGALCSEDLGWVYGQVLLADGGATHL